VFHGLSLETFDGVIPRPAGMTESLAPAGWARVLRPGFSTLPAPTAALGTLPASSTVVRSALDTAMAAGWRWLR